MARLNVQNFVAPMGRITRATSTNINDLSENALDSVLSTIKNSINDMVAQSANNFANAILPDNQVETHPIQQNALDNWLQNNNLSMLDINTFATTDERTRARLLARDRGISDEMALITIVGGRLLTERGAR